MLGIVCHCCQSKALLRVISKRLGTTHTQPLRTSPSFLTNMANVRTTQGDSQETTTSTLTAVHVLGESLKRLSGARRKAVDCILRLAQCALAGRSGHH